MSLSRQMNAVQNESRNVLGKSVSNGDSVALVDYPAYLNPGDTLIFEGVLGYLLGLGARAGYVSALHSHDDQLMAAYVPEGPILLQGGGNFGDRYPRHQLFREHIVATNPHRVIVQLPQTMDFTDESNLVRAQRVYARHPDLTVLIRDHAGVAHARSAFPDNRVEFCPDMAFGAGLLSPSRTPSHEVVVVKRVDRESLHTSAALPHRLSSISHVTDWDVGIRYMLKWWLTTHAETRLHGSTPRNRRMYPHMRRAFSRQSAALLRSAIDVLSRGRVVVTDRLHAAIFGALLGKPVIMVDNANHKLSAAHESYLHAFPDVHLARDFDHAADLVDTLV